MAANYNTFLQTAAAAYGFDVDVLKGVHHRENSGRTTFDVNNWDSNAAAGTPSGGPFQFIKPTFDAYARQAKQANPAAWKGVPLKWENPYAQALAASWAMANGKGKAWSTYGKAVAAAGGVQRTRPQTNPTALSQPQSGSGDASTAETGLTPEKRAVLVSVFDTNPGMQRILGMIPDATKLRVDAARPAAVARQAISTGAAPVTKGGPGNDYRSLFAWASKNFGARLDNPNLDDPNNPQTIGGSHAAGSHHYAGRAIDLGDAKNDPATLRRIAAYARRNPHLFSELFFNKLGWGIKNGRVVKGLSVPGHDNHMHIAVRG